MQKIEIARGTVICFQEKDVARGMRVLQHCGNFITLPNGNYIVINDHLALFKSEKIPYEVIDSL